MNARHQAQSTIKQLKESGLVDKAFDARQATAILVAEINRVLAVQAAKEAKQTTVTTSSTPELLEVQVAAIPVVSAKKSAKKPAKKPTKTVGERWYSFEDVASYALGCGYKLQQNASRWVLDLYDSNNVIQTFLLPSDVVRFLDSVA